MVKKWNAKSKELLTLQKDLIILTKLSDHFDPNPNSCVLCLKTNHYSNNGNHLLP